MRVLIGGGSGMLGRNLQERLRKNGHEVYILSRTDSTKKEVIQWSPKVGEIDSNMTFDVVVNLAGAGLVDHAWTPKYQKIIVESRTLTTKTLDHYFQKNNFTPDVYLNASAIGYYGHHPTKIFTEEDEAIQSDFLVIVCEAWERAVHDMQTKIPNKYIARIGMVLTEKGGVFPKISTGRPIGIVPHLGDGSQFFSWIHIEDLMGIFQYLIEDRPPSGIYNAVAPNPETNKSVSKMIASTGILGLSPPVPEFMIRMILGKRAVAVLNSTRVSGQKIMDAGYEFEYTELPDAVNDLVSNLRWRPNR